MAGLIPLSLNREDSSRYSLLFADGDQPLSSRCDCTIMRPKPLKFVKRSSQPPALPPLRLLPYSSSEWKRTLSDIKRDFLNRQYQPCYTRCQEIIDGVKNWANVEAAHIIYLRFYAASALEMQTRNLQHTSPYRLKLLQQAREHYQIASDLAVEEDAALRRPFSRTLSPVPSLHSSFDSEGSYSTVSTRMSSPAPSLSSLDGCMKSPESIGKPKKRVAFRDVPIYEPIIRPDSPTLGFDDWFSRPSSPEVVPEPVAMPRYAQSEEKPLPALPLPSPTMMELQHEEDPIDLFLRERSIHHFCTILNSMLRQIQTHMAALDNDIIAAMDPRPPHIMTEELRALEIRTRIERLRANGWQRPRFNARRYETLREDALADMM